jgi:hypothetical protein
VKFSLEDSNMLRTIILNAEDRKCQSIATVYIYIYIYIHNDQFHMATCFDLP